MFWLKWSKFSFAWLTIPRVSRRPGGFALRWGYLYLRTGMDID